MVNVFEEPESNTTVHPSPSPFALAAAIIGGQDAEGQSQFNPKKLTPTITCISDLNPIVIVDFSAHLEHDSDGSNTTSRNPTHPNLGLTMAVVAPILSLP